MSNLFHETSPIRPMSSRLGRRLILLLILISGTITLITTLTQLYFDYSKELTDVHKRHNEIENIHTPALAAYLWDFDLILLQQRIQGLENLPNIDYLQVRSGNYEFATGTPVRQKAYVSHFPLIYTDLDTNQTHNIGTLTVESDMTEIYVLLLKRFLVILGLNSLKTAIVCYLILIIFHKSISTRIYTIATYLKGYSPRHSTEPLVVHHPAFISQEDDELAVLGSEANKLTGNLSALYLNIRKEQERLTDFAEVASDWLWETDDQLLLVYCSDMMTRTLEILDYHHFKLTDIPMLSRATPLAHQLSLKQSFDFCEISVETNNQTRFFVFKATARYSDNQFLGYRGTAIDISELKQAQLQLEQLNRNLEVTVQQRTKDLESSLNQLQTAQNQLIETEKLAALGGLVAGVAHEVNTPLGIAVTASSIISESSDELMKAFNSQTLTTEQFSELMEKLVHGTTLLNHNLNRAATLVKNFKQTAVDQISETQDKFNVAQVIQALIISLHPLTRKVPVVPEIEGDNSLIMDSFPGVLTQIISNLITNSINHAFDNTPTPAIHLDFHQENDVIVLTYRDNGKGVPAKLHKKIFEPFFTSNRQKGGSGLGLNLVFNLVTQKLRGTLTFSSQEGQGVEFVLRIPLIHHSDA